MPPVRGSRSVATSLRHSHCDVLWQPAALHFFPKTREPGGCGKKFNGPATSSVSSRKDELSKSESQHTYIACSDFRNYPLVHMPVKRATTSCGPTTLLPLPLVVTPRLVFSETVAPPLLTEPLDRPSWRKNSPPGCADNADEGRTLQQSDKEHRGNCATLTRQPHWQVATDGTRMKHGPA